MFDTFKSFNARSGGKNILENVINSSAPWTAPTLADSNEWILKMFL
jgi:hypothetical protein